MKTYAFYGLVLSMISVLMSLVMFFTGLQTTQLEYANYVQWIGMVVSWVVLFLGVDAARQQRPDQRIGYGAALGGTLMISLVAAVIGGAYTYFHFSTINTSFADYMVDFQRNKMIAAGMSDDFVEKFTEGMQKGMTPLSMARNAAIGTVFFGFLLGLLHAGAHIQRLSVRGLLILNGSVCAVFGALGGAGSGFMVKKAGVYALIGLSVGAIGAVLITYFLLKHINYTVRPDPDAAA